MFLDYCGGAGAARRHAGFDGFIRNSKVTAEITVDLSVSK